MKRNKGQLRTMAFEAKKRLSGGFWVNNNYKRVELENIYNMNGEDEIFYRKIEQVIRLGEMNPLSAMLDYDYMAGLDDAGRQRYVLNMSDRVNNSVARYNKVC